MFPKGGLVLAGLSPLYCTSMHLPSSLQASRSKEFRDTLPQQNVLCPKNFCFCRSFGCYAKQYRLYLLSLLHLTAKTQPCIGGLLDPSSPPMHKGQNVSLSCSISISRFTWIRQIWILRKTAIPYFNLFNLIITFDLAFSFYLFLPTSLFHLTLTFNLTFTFFTCSQPIFFFQFTLLYYYWTVWLQMIQKGQKLHQTSECQY